jgi:hypothetical protein
LKREAKLLGIFVKIGKVLIFNHMLKLWKIIQLEKDRLEEKMRKLQTGGRKNDTTEENAIKQ